MAVQDKRVPAEISSVSAGDMGLKIGVKYGKEKERMGFIPIIGWATVGNYQAAGTHAFTPVIKGPDNIPMLASKETVKGFAGVFPANAIVDDLFAADPDERPV
jgi:hypothetical protein